jgi:hypothetical protein
MRSHEKAYQDELERLKGDEKKCPIRESRGIGK